MPEEPHPEDLEPYDEQGLLQLSEVVATGLDHATYPTTAQIRSLISYMRKQTEQAIILRNECRALRRNARIRSDIAPLL